MSEKVQMCINLHIVWLRLLKSLKTGMPFAISCNVIIKVKLKIEQLVVKYDRSLLVIHFYVDNLMTYQIFVLFGKTNNPIRFYD